MVSLKPISHAHSVSLSAETPNPHRLTLLFGVMIASCCVVAIYLYCWLQRSFEDLGNQALERKEFQKAADCFTRWLNAPAVEGEKKYQKVIEGCEKALSSPNLVVQSQARFLILRGEANLGLNKPAEAVQDFKAALELSSENLNPDDFSRVIQGCENALLSSNLEVQSRAEVQVLKGRANMGLNNPLKAYEEYSAAFRLLSLNLKSREFSKVISCSDYVLKRYKLEEELQIRFHFLKGLAYLGLQNLSEAKDCFSKVISCSDCALKSDKLEKESHADFHFLKGGAYLGLQNPSEAKQCFFEALKSAPRESKLLVPIYYCLALTYKQTGDDFYAGELCDMALVDKFAADDTELKTEILTLKALSLMGGRRFPDAIETADSALQRSITDKTPKEILSALYFCLASSYCAQKKYADGFPYFTQALANVENDPFLRAYILSCRGYYHRVAALDSQVNFPQAEQDFQEASQCKSDDRCDRSELLRCMMWPMFEKLTPEESPVTRLAKKIEEDRKAHSVPEPQE